MTSGGSDPEVVEKYLMTVQQNYGIWSLGSIGAVRAQLDDPDESAKIMDAAKKIGDYFSKGDVVLFQGDSITDAGRARKTASKPNRQEPLGLLFDWTLRYYREVFGRDSWNDADVYAVANVHVGNNYVNAYWSPCNM